MSRAIGWTRDQKPAIFWFGENKPAHFDEDEGQAIHGDKINVEDEDKLIGDLMTVQEWLESVECGGFIDYDGFGDQVIYNPDKNEYYVVERTDTDMGVIYPSMADRLPPWTTHIVWYNR